MRRTPLARRSQRRRTRAAGRITVHAAALFRAQRAVAAAHRRKLLVTTLKLRT